MSMSISDQNPKITILNIATVRESLNYITKFGLPLSITQYINIYLIFYDVYINNPIIILDI